MKVLLIGADGQLGSDLYATLKEYDLIPLTQEDIEICDMESVLSNCRKYEPDIVINTASYIRVDDCEDNVDLAYRVNAVGARNVAVAAQEIGAVLVHLSSDYVFGGDSKRSIPYTEFDTPAPINVYGKSKLAGEKYVEHLCSRCFIVRSSALFGLVGSVGKGGNFAETIINQAQRNEEIRVVTDQFICPTYSPDLAAKIAQILNSRFYGVFHITNSGACSWYEFSVEILRLLGSKAIVIPVSSGEYPRRAARPGYAVLDNYQLKLLGIDDMRDWRKALAHYMSVKGYLPQ